MRLYLFFISHWSFHWSRFYLIPDLPFDSLALIEFADVIFSSALTYVWIENLNSNRKKRDATCFWKNHGSNFVLKTGKLLIFKSPFFGSFGKFSSSFNKMVFFLVKLPYSEFDVGRFVCSGVHCNDKKRALLGFQTTFVLTSIIFYEIIRV